MTLLQAVESFRRRIPAFCLIINIVHLMVRVNVVAIYFSLTKIYFTLLWL